MANENRDIAMYIAVYDSLDSAKQDLDAIEQLHRDQLIGTFDAAVVDKEDGTPHVVKRLDRPMVRVIPEWVGLGKLRRKELHQAAVELGNKQAGLIMVGEPTIDKAFDKAVTHAANVVKSHFDATADELAREMEEAVTP